MKKLLGYIVFPTVTIAVMLIALCATQLRAGGLLDGIGLIGPSQHIIRATGTLTAPGSNATVPTTAAVSAAITAAGGGDVSSNATSSVNNEVALFVGIGGKTIKRAVITGLAKLTAGVLSAASAGVDYLAPNGNGSALVGLTKTQVGLANVPNTDATKPTNIGQNASFRFHTDTQNATWSGKQNALGYTAANVANLDNNSSLGTSATKWPTQNATKSYIATTSAAKVHTHNATIALASGTVPAARLPANSNSTAGIVESGAGKVSQVWKTDASGVPGWRDDDTSGTPAFNTCLLYTSDAADE